MGQRRAILIGVEKYGAGLDPLPSASQDVAIMQSALTRCGYKTEIKPSEGLEAGTILDDLRRFCEECDEGDTHLIYFSGHGISVEGKDYVIPGGVGRKEADDNEYKRIRTDLTDFVGMGLVIFVIDACRDEGTSKGHRAFGYETAGNDHFVRFLGCSKGEVCQVIPGGYKGKDVSLFTKALGEALVEGTYDSLSEVLRRVTELCEASRANLRRQIPHLSHGETSDAVAEVLRRRVFEPQLSSELWTKFEPNRMHCLLIVSEFEMRARPMWTLQGLVRGSLKGIRGRRVWEAFRRYGNGLSLLSGSQRTIPERLGDGDVVFATVAIHQAFDEQRYNDVVRALVEADLVVFDVTKFEPGVMLLMGIRSAARRGVSICTHGHGWRELDELDIPFNLRDISLGSHTESQGGRGRDPVYEDMVSRIERGFEQMRRQPQYQDLPAYDPLRQLGPDVDAAATKDYRQRILFLGSFGKKYRESNWEVFQNALEGALHDKLTQGEADAQVVRLVDYGSPQLVSRSLYELIRRTAGCVVDWTEYSPSSFFELGVRLAATHHGAIQFVDRRYLPGEDNAERWDLMSMQIQRMRELFKPHVYEPDVDEHAFQVAAAQLLSDYPSAPTTGYHRDRVYRVASNTIKDVEEAQAPVPYLLKNLADSLHHPDTERFQYTAPHVLFRETSVRRDSQRAATEARVAAWLYLHHRMKVDKLDPADPLRELYVELANAALSALYEDGDIDMADYIKSQLDQLETKDEHINER